MIKLSVAGLPLCIESADKAFFEKRFSEYIREDDREPMMTMVTRLVNRVELPKGETVQQLQDATVLRLADGRFCRFLSKEGEVPFAIYCTEDYAQVEIQLCSRWRNRNFTLTDSEYMYTGMMFHNRLVRLGGGVLHSSSIAFRGQGLAFSANSGTGKSTHVGLWGEAFGDEITVVNDDKPALYFDGEQLMIAGTPWSGKTALNHNVQVPLKAVVFIERGTENRVRRLSSVEAFARLIEQIAVPYYDAALGESAVDLADRILRSVPVYCLNCSISQDAVRAVYGELFTKGDTVK